QETALLFVDAPPGAARAPTSTIIWRWVRVALTASESGKGKYEEGKGEEKRAQVHWKSSQAQPKKRATAQLAVSKRAGFALSAVLFALPRSLHQPCSTSPTSQHPRPTSPTDVDF